MKALSRRQLIAYGSQLGSSAAALAASKSASALTLHRPMPERAIFIYIHGGSVDGTWFSGCTQLSRRPPAAFKNYWHRCSFFENVDHLTAGFGTGTIGALASQNPFLDQASLDTRIAQHLGGSSSQSPLNHLRLMATSFNEAAYTPSIENGEIISSAQFIQEPQQLLSALQDNPGEHQSTRLNEIAALIDTPEDSFDWRSDRMMELSTLALQSNQCSVATLMLGDGDGAILPPADIGLREDVTWRALPPTSGNRDLAITFQNYLHSKVVYLLELLANTPDRFGRPLLDTTLVFQCSNMGESFAYTSRGGNYFIAGADALFHHGLGYTDDLSHCELLNLIAHSFGIAPQEPSLPYPQLASRFA